MPLPRWGKVKNYDQPSPETGWVQTVEKPLTGFSDKFLQSAARTPCSPMANNSHSDALRAAYGGCALHSAAALDLQPEMYFLSGTRPDRK